MSPSAINPYSIDRTAENLFYGRQSQLKQLRDDLCAPVGRSYSIIGGRRFGKSSILKKLQRTLLQTPIASWEARVVPIYVNLLGSAASITSQDEFFTTVAMSVSRQIESHQDERSIRNPVTSLVFSSADPCYRTFGEWLVQLCNALASGNDIPRIVLLLDEIELILQRTWKNDLLASLRMLVYEDDLYSRLFSVVISGSVEFHREVEDHGSPLWQVLNPLYLSSLSEDESLRLIQEPSKGEVPKSVANEIVLMSGGHPYLVQYLMQNLWSELPEVSVDNVHALAAHFRVSRTPLLSGWQHALGDVGLRVYQTLIDSDAWTSRKRINELVRAPNITTALKSICYHGFAIPRDSYWTHFRYAGELFRTWFLEDYLPGAQMAFSAEKRHMEVQRQELDRRYNDLTKRIEALDADIAVGHDSEHLLLLKERRTQKFTEREDIAKQLGEIEIRLANSHWTSSG